jgi:hypothetical protein
VILFDSLVLFSLSICLVHSLWATTVSVASFATGATHRGQCSHYRKEKVVLVLALGGEKGLGKSVIVSLHRTERVAKRVHVALTCPAATRFWTRPVCTETRSSTRGGSVLFPKKSRSQPVITRGGTVSSVTEPSHHQH